MRVAVVYESLMGNTLRVAAPEGFMVEDMAGPLRAGELERAAVWASCVVAECAAAVPPRRDPVRR